MTKIQKEKQGYRPKEIKKRKEIARTVFNKKRKKIDWSDC